MALSDEECYLIDPLAIEDLSPFGTLLSDQNVIKLFHDAPQGLSILHKATGAVPKNIFDTRLASGFAGLSATLSLGNLIQELLDITFLSESRFLHLFKEQTGLPVRNFIHWCKIQHAIKAIMNGANFTEAAYDAGFSDSAHFSRVFKLTFGISPSLLLKSRSTPIFCE